VPGSPKNLRTARVWRRPSPFSFGVTDPCCVGFAPRFETRYPRHKLGSPRSGGDAYRRPSPKM